MDAFTENILARARERQKLLEGYSGGERTPLRETNTVFVQEPKKIHRESLSDSNIHCLSNKIDPTLKEKENKSDSNLNKSTSQNLRTRVSSEMPGSPKNQLKTLNIQQDNFNMEIKVTSSENIRVEVEIAESTEHDDEDGSGSDSGMRSESKSKLKRLGQLYAGGDEANISSPIHRTEAKFCANDTIVEGDKQSNVSKTPRKGLGKLADLAQTINEWEDDIHHVQLEKKSQSPSKKTWKPQAPQPSHLPNENSPVKLSCKSKAPEPSVVKEVPSSIKKSQSSTSQRGTIKQINNSANNSIQVVGAIAKNVNWDQNVLDKLESQGFTRTQSKSRLVYSYNSQDKSKDTKKLESLDEESTQEEIPKENKIKHLASALEAKIEQATEKQNNPTKNKPINFVKQPSSPMKQPSNPVKEPLSPVKTIPVHLRANNIAERAAVFENSPTRLTKDPALLSVSERKALFEKNKGEALVPKAAFGMAPAMKTETVMKACCTKIMNTDSSLKQSNPAKQMEKILAQIETTHSSPKSAKKLPAPQPAVVVEKKSPTVAAVPQAGGIATMMAALLENKSTISQHQIESSIKNERQKEMDMLLNRFNRNKELVEDVVNDVSDEDDEADATEKTAMITSKPAKMVTSDEKRISGEKRKSGGKPYSKGDSPVVAAVLEDIKRIKVTQPKEGRLYPNLSDIEATTETDTENFTRTPSPNEDNNSSFDTSNDSDDPNTSFGRDILQVVCKNQSPQKRPIYDESTASDISSILDDMDNYLEELSNEDNTSVGPTPPKQVRQITPQKSAAQPSNSFHYKNFSPAKSMSKNCKGSPDKSLPEYIVEGDNILPLTHTVSFYRKQQNLAQSPAHQISRQPIIEDISEENNSDESQHVNEKIKELHEEVNKQQNIISQTSQALNLCSCTPEFSGSTEQVEAERVLLVATHRRQAALHEIQRLKVEGTIRPQGQHAKNLPLEKGTLTISNIVLPLKHKYVKALAAAGGKGHHIVCLIKCGEQVVPTKLTSTVVHSAKNPDTELLIPGSVVLHNIYSDFTVTFEVYCLQAQEEFLPHEVKYHINKKSSNKLVTPKKSKQESRMIMPIKESPAGPQAVRSSSFAVMGYAVFSVQAVNKRVWNLNNTPPMSPLEGTVEMRICCDLAVSVEHRGFLTMFEDVSGFGAWHRRWFLLKGHTMSYWKYPDDEKTMAPINSIDLKNCITKEVKPVNREICARLHTLLLEMERPAYSSDKDSLVTVCKGDKTVVRHLLSADTKQERIEWCAKFNASLTALRMWGNCQQ